MRVNAQVMRVINRTGGLLTVQEVKSSMDSDVQMENTPVLPSKEKGKLKAVFHQGLPWVEKYRPNDLNDLVSHQEIIKTSNLL